MSFTYKFLLALLVALAVPASAAAAPGSIRTLEHGEFGQLFMDASQTNPRDNSVTILPGETVTFSYAVGDGQNAHNVDFYTFSPKPNTCVQTAGHRRCPASRSRHCRRSPYGALGRQLHLQQPGDLQLLLQGPRGDDGHRDRRGGQNTPPAVSASRTPTGDVHDRHVDRVQRDRLRRRR